MSGFSRSPRRIQAPRWLRRLGASLLIGGQAMSAMAKGQINFNDLTLQLQEAGPGSFLIVFITALAAGTVFNIQVAAELTKQGAGSTVGGLLAIGLSREIAPLLTATLLTGKVATAYAAELGTMKVTEQIDAITMLRTDPVQFLVVAMPAFLLGWDLVGPGKQHLALQHPANRVLELGAHLDAASRPAFDAAQSRGLWAPDCCDCLRLGTHHQGRTEGSGHQHHRGGGHDFGHSRPGRRLTHQIAIRLMDDPLSQPGSQGVVLAPRYGVPIGVVVLGLGCLALLPLWGGALWLAGVVVVLGLFLFLQAALLRLEFAPDALLVWRQTSLLRRFPYADWLGWKLFWPAVPVLFYFREQRSIHLLPMLFDATSLREQLDHHLSSLPREPDASDA